MVRGFFIPIFRKEGKQMENENKKSVVIMAYLQGELLTRTVYTQTQGYLIIEQLAREGCRNICFNFDEMDALPKGVNYHDKFGVAYYLI